MVALLIAGIAAFTAGILALLFGIPIKEFSFGNTMIITGAIVASAGMLTVGMWILAREIRILAARAGGGVAVPNMSARTAERGPDIAPALPQPSRPTPEPVLIGDITAPPPVDDDDRPPLPKQAWPESEVEAPPPKPKRNLLFASSSRRERERAAAKSAEPETPAAPSPAPPAPFDPAAAASDIPDIDPRDSFESAWPQAEVARPAPPRRREHEEDRPQVAPPPRSRPEPRMEPRSPPPVPTDVTVLKSGVVDGMAYSLYSDGSIEAQMPEGMVRFASIDELRAHLDGRA